MNADLKRVRDSTAGIDEHASPAKKRALSVSTPPPPDSSDDDRLEDWMKVVETRRKEAIYRQMLEYKRLHAEEARRTRELEAQKRVLEASVQAVEVCWNQLVSAVGDLAGSSDLGVPAGEADQTIIEPGMASQELDQALQSRLPATKRIITKFVDMTAKDGVRPAIDDLHTKCGRLQAESSVLRSSSQTLQKQVSTLTESRDALQRDLARAQKALDRQRMEHDKVEREWQVDRERGRDSATPGVSRPANGSGHATPNGHVEPDLKPFDAAGPAALLQDTTELEQKAESRLKNLETLRSEHTVLQQELDRLRLINSRPTEHVLRESPFFQVYLHQLSLQYSKAADLQQRCDANEKKLDELRNNNFEFREAVLAEAKAESEALRQQMSRKDADLARLRSQRDDMNAELLERKAKEVEKMTFADGVEALANERQERIAILVAEVQRLKGRLGAESGSEGYLAFLLGEGGIDGDYVKDLEIKLKDAEIQIAIKTDPATADLEAVRVELDKAKQALAKYEKILGPDSDAAEDVKQLADRLAEVEKDRETMQLKLSQAEQSTNSLYTETEALVKMWEGANKQVTSKVYDLKDGELKISRLATEKAKADNKYFQAMRTKEAVEVECRTAQRSLEKQGKLLEKAHEVEKGLNAQISAHEKGFIALKNSAMDLQSQLTVVSSEKTQLELRLKQAQSSLVEAEKIMEQRVTDHACEKTLREKAQEELEASNTKLKKLKERQEAMNSSSNKGVSANEVELREERDKLWKLMRCSCCQNGLKQKAITRCMHTFCADCLDQRLASRQRKCPACGTAFSREEVQTIYWQ